MNKIQICNQIELNYIDEGEGIPIILIHGLDGNLAGFKDLKNELKKQYRVITYDVRGHGKSSRTESYELKDHAEDLNDLMGALNIDSAHILGHDMGGIIASEFTEKYQYKVITLTIVSAKSEDIANGFNKLMVDYQEELAGFNKSEAMIILFSLFRMNVVVLLNVYLAIAMFNFFYMGLQIYVFSITGSYEGILAQFIMPLIMLIGIAPAVAGLIFTAIFAMEYGIWLYLLGIVAVVVYILLFYAGSVAVGAWRLNKGMRE